ncbi:MAG TPA: hypothetical protein VLG50_00920 [Candidatus Saccharimonadales bacterium]|nr:hypothetical protein [Candidatus Saccharimonadales bacterium]
MFKKIMLILGCSSLIGTNSVQARHNDTTIVGAVAVTAVAIGTGLYWAMREGNDIKIARVEELSRAYARDIRPKVSEIAALQDVQVFMMRAPEYEREINFFDDRVQKSYAEISNRFHGWFTPWNNTVSMHHAYQTISDLAQRWEIDLHIVRDKMSDMSQRMTALQAIAYFKPIMNSWNLSTEEKDILKIARKICQGNSLYPIHDSLQKIQNAIAAIHKNRQHVPCDYALIDKMEQLESELLSTAAYVEETRIRKEEQRAQEELELKKRLALAEERKAQAEEQKARAVTQQAKSQVNQNRIARESNRIERNRTGQGSWWLDFCDALDNLSE